MGRMLKLKETRKGLPANVSGVSVLGGRNHMDGGSEWDAVVGEAARLPGCLGELRGGVRWGYGGGRSQHHPGPLFHAQECAFYSK